MRVLLFLIISVTSISSYVLTEFGSIDESYFYETPSVGVLNTSLLQSRPGATNCILLWNTGLSNSGYIMYTVSPSLELKVFNTVSEDFYPFDVNVTTDTNVYKSYPVKNRAAGVYVKAGGKATWLGCFGKSKKAHAEFGPEVNTPSHELGHVLGVSHDAGYMSGDWPVAMILGGGQVENGPTLRGPITHWYNGYKNKTHNQEDDLGIISRFLGYIKDDHTDPVPITINENNTITPDKNVGGIQNQSDVDEWTFSLLKEDVVSFTIKPNAIRSPNLFVGSWITNEYNDTVAMGVSAGKYNMESHIESVSLPSGKYTLHIDGIAPKDTWLNDYSSFGPYRIFGEIKNAVGIKNTIDKTEYSFLIKSNKLQLGESHLKYSSVQILSLNGRVLYSGQVRNGITVDLKEFIPQRGAYVLSVNGVAKKFIYK